MGMLSGLVASLLFVMLGPHIMNPQMDGFEERQCFPYIIQALLPFQLVF